MHSIDEDPWLQLWPDIRFSFKEPNLTIHTIRQALPKICRYGGNVRFFYSVAQHAFYMAQEALTMENDPLLAYLCLHHDDNEVIGGDPPGPLKTQYEKQREECIQGFIWSILGVQPEWLEMYAAQVKQLDRLIRYNEGWTLQPNAVDDWPNRFAPGLKTLNASPIQQWSVDDDRAGYAWAVHHNLCVDLLVGRGWLELNQIEKFNIWNLEWQDNGCDSEVGSTVSTEGERGC